MITFILICIAIALFVFAGGMVVSIALSLAGVAVKVLAVTLIITCAVLESLYRKIMRKPA